MKDFDQILNYIGDFGYYQKTIYFISCAVSIFVGMHMLSNVFIMAVPKSRCHITGCDNGVSDYFEPFVPYTIPLEGTGYSQCSQFRQSNATNFTCVKEDFLNLTTECLNGWTWDRSEFDSTTVTEWNLVCSSSWVISLSQSLFMAGVLVGSMVFGTISDRFGRRIVFFISPILVVTSSVAAAFSTNWITYTAIKFITAIAINGIFQTGFVVVVEFIGISKRAWCGNMIQVFFAIGELVLAAIAYCIRDWRELQLTISIPLGLLLFYPCLVPESVRWLLSCGRISEAKTIIMKVASKNSRPMTSEVVDSFLEVSSSSSQSSLVTRNKAGYFDIFKSPILLRRSLNIFFNWTVNSLVYYGLSLSASNLSGNTYVNFVALAAVEIPAVILATVVQQWKGRRFVLCTVLLMGGLSCIGSNFIPKGYDVWSTVLAVFGKSNIAASFAVIYIYTAEIFPTPLRNTGIGISSTFSRIGGIVAPIIADLGNYNPGLPMYVFGGSSVAAGLLSLFLPETHNRKLPETIEEAERFGRSTKLSSSHLQRPLLNDEDDEYRDEEESIQAPLLSEKSR